MKRFMAFAIFIAQVFLCLGVTTIAGIKNEDGGAGIQAVDFAEPVEVMAKQEQESEKIYTFQYDISGIDEFVRPDLIPMIEDIATQYGICPELIEAIIETESEGESEAYASEGSYGLMQIYKRWHTDRMERLGVTDLFDDYGNIIVGTDYLSQLVDMYGEDLYLVLGTYNGQSDCAEGVENDYAKKIIDRARDLERLHESQGYGL